MKRYIEFKNLLDYIFALLLTILLSPLLLLIALLIKLDSKGPILFKQRRIGKDNVEFEIYKFRSMGIEAPKDLPTHVFTNAESYITGVGTFLRKSSLDELPQLFNILKGQMSFIGPRPALWNQYDLIDARKLKGAEKIKPGITGWAQVNGRDELSIESKATFDGYYAEEVNFLLDAKILVKTITVVITHKGIAKGNRLISKK